MKQKIVIQVTMRCDKCRSKALKIASVAQGRVSSVALEGDDRDRVVVIGEDVDPVCLAKDLRKKFGHANIISVAEDKKKEEKPKELPICYYYPPSFPSSYVACDTYPNNICTIM